MSDLLQFVAATTGAASARPGERLQSLWSGYGEIRRIHLEGGPGGTVIVKDVDPPEDGGHPRGWASDRGHARKLRSYEVEWAFYREVAGRCPGEARVPRYLGGREHGAGWTLVLEDLDAAGFAGRRGRASEDEIRACLGWLAAFHATFLGDAPAGLWPTGTYWHLATRPDELAAMPAGALRDAAGAIDARLEAAGHRTLVHGDAKVANFCFGPRGVAAVDFQYVGGGVGVKDLAYFLGSVLGEGELEEVGDAFADAYYRELRGALERAGKGTVAAAVEAEWRGLEALAWADFSRFLQGWAPGHGKLHGYSRRRTEEALAAL